jgi:mannan endo-1,4-beta-mannosidase
MKKIIQLKKNSWLLILLVFFTIAACETDSDEIDPNLIEEENPNPEEEEEQTREFSIDQNLINTNSSESTIELYNYLRSQFGHNVISGQTYQQEQWDYIEALTGKLPVMREYDLQPYSSGYPYMWDNECGCHAFGINPNATVVEDAIEWYETNNGKPIIKFQWHWHSPSGGAAGTNTFYTESTDFDVSEAVITGTEENDAIIRDIDSIATQLKKFSVRGIPVLWRPLHEIDGGWFWWSAHGPEPAKALWNIMYDRLVNYHGLNNLIWMWNGEDPGWYVGNDKCDLVSLDSYPEEFDYDILEESFDDLYDITNGTKIIGISENGAIPDMEEAFNNGITWSFFITWVDHLSSANSDQHIKDVYNNPNIITLEDRD